MLKTPDFQTGTPCAKGWGGAPKRLHQTSHFRENDDVQRSTVAKAAEKPLVAAAD